MASVPLYLIFLFTITFIGSFAQENNAATSIKAGLVLVPGPHQINAYPLDPLLLDCNVEVTDQSLLPLTFTWLKNGEVLESKRSFILQNGTLFLKPFKTVDRQLVRNGIYTCKVTTAHGDSAITRQVAVVFASIAKEYAYSPVQTVAFEGGSARFWCDISAEPSASIQWIKDNSNLNPLTFENQRYTILPAGILQISPVVASDAGLYWCSSRFNLELDRYAEYKISEKASLTVVEDGRPRPPKILAGPSDIDVEAGKSAILECLVDGNPMPTVQWRKKGLDGAVRDGRLYGHNNLIIPLVSLEHDGVYECLVMGPNGIANISSATLTVLVQPTLLEDTPSHLLPVSRSKSITCPVSGKPEPNIEWFYNGNPIDTSQRPSNHKISDGGRRLLLLYIRNTDSGYYQCIASNKAGVAISITRIMLNIKENAPDRPRNVTAIATSSSTVQISVDFSPGTEFSVIQFQVQGEDPKLEVLNLKGLDLSETYETEIRGLKPFTNYSVEVQALSKKNGASDHSDKVYVQTKEAVPLAAPSLSLTNPNYHTILVSWSPLTAEQSQGKVIKYRIFYKAEDAPEVLEDVPADQTSFYIRDVEPETVYNVQVLAATGAGFPPRNEAEAMKHTTPAVNASSPPRLTLKYINDTSVRVSWQSPGLLSNEDRVIGFSFNITNLSDDSENLPLKHFNVNSSVHLKYVTDLDPYAEYEVTLVAVMKTSFSGTSSRKFQLATLKLQPEPWHFSVADITAHNISLVWTPVANGKVQYELCYSKVAEAAALCNRTYDTSWTVENLDSYTNYLFRARALLHDGYEHFSKKLIVKTREDSPSPPVQVSVEVLKPKVVRVQWLPPLYKNGELKTYIVNYTHQAKGSNLEPVWKSIIQKATSNSAVIEDLEFGLYLFRVVAVNSVGPSKPSQKVSAVPLCLEETACQVDVIPGAPNTVEISWNKKASLPAKAIWIIAAFISFIVLVVIAVIAFCYKRRRRLQQDSSLNSSHTPFFPSNGHVGSSAPAAQSGPWTGQAGSPNGLGYGPGDIISPHEFAPMLNQMRENTHLDSKGGPETIMSNGLYPNGLIRANKPPPFENEAEKLKDNAQDYGDLMAALIESNGVKMSKLGPSVLGVEEISMSRLDRRDKGDPAGQNEDADRDEGDRLVDQSSEDSGTECRHAGMLGSREDGSHVASPASSPGGLSLEQQLVWGLGADVCDELLDSQAPVIGLAACSPHSANTGGSQPGKTFCEGDEESASNDRDSGHGGEVKAQPDGTKNTMCDSGHAELLSDSASIPSDSHSAVLSLCSPHTAASNDSSSPLVVQSSQQQLPHPDSRSATSQPHNNHNRLHLPNLRQRHIDLPLPPPPPPPPSAAAADSEVVAIRDGKSKGKLRGPVNGSSDSRQPQEFSPPRPPPSPPNIA